MTWYWTAIRTVTLTLRDARVRQSADSRETERGANRAHLSLVFVAVLTSSCCTRVDSLPTICWHGHAKHLQPGTC